MGEMTLTERVAKALYEYDAKSDLLDWTNHELPWEEQEPHVKAIFLKRARAAIAAMREPTPTLLTALEDLMDYPGTDRTHEQMWAGLIDVALK